jgi:hypothetical protein
MSSTQTNNNVYDNRPQPQIFGLESKFVPVIAYVLVYSNVEIPKHSLPFMLQSSYMLKRNMWVDARLHPHDFYALPSLSSTLAQMEQYDECRMKKRN